MTHFILHKNRLFIFILQEEEHVKHDVEPQNISNVIPEVDSEPTNLSTSINSNDKLETTNTDTSLTTSTIEEQPSG